MSIKKSNRSEYLKAKDDLRIYLRGCSKHMVDAVHKVIIYAEAEREEKKRLEEELRKYKQTEMFSSKPPQPYIPPVKEDKVWGPSLKERIVDMLKNNETHTGLWKSMLRHNNLTHEQAIAIYDEWKRR